MIPLVIICGPFNGNTVVFFWKKSCFKSNIALEDEVLGISSMHVRFKCREVFSIDQFFSTSSIRASYLEMDALNGSSHTLKGNFEILKHWPLLSGGKVHESTRLKNQSIEQSFCYYQFAVGCLRRHCLMKSFQFKNTINLIRKPLILLRWRS